MMNTFDHIVAIGLGIVLPVIGVVSARRSLREGIDPDRRERRWMVLSNAATLWIFAGIVLAAWAWSARGIAALGFHRTPIDRVVVVSLGSVALVWVAMSLWQLRSAAGVRAAIARARRHTPFMPRSLAEIGPFLLLAVSAGITEEIVFRGHLVSFVMHYVEGAPGAFALAVGIPAIPFALLHLYQGWLAALMVFGLSVAFGVIYLHTGSLLIPIVAHALLDVLGCLHTVLVEHRVRQLGPVAVGLDESGV